MSIKDYIGFVFGYLAGIYLILSMMGCDNMVIQNKQLISLASDFSTHYNVSIKNISLNLVPEAPFFEQIGAGYGENVIGVCERNGITVDTVDIDNDYWVNATAISRRGLIYHELGHCALNLQHVNTLDSEGCATTYMNATIPDDYCLAKIFTADGISY